MKLPFNQEVHDNLLVLGYILLLRYKNKYDEYNHPNNDDWISVDKKGHVDFPDVCDYINDEAHKYRVRANMDQNMIKRISYYMKAVLEQKKSSYVLDITGNKVGLFLKN